MELDNQQERLVASVYVAAMIQGEGSILLDLNKRRGAKIQITPRVVIYNTDLEVIDKLVRCLNQLGVGCHCWWSKTTKTPIAHVKVLGFKRVSSLFPHVLPYLVGLKRRKAELIQAWIDRRRAAPKRAPYTKEDLESATAIRILRDQKLGPSV